MLYPKIYYLFVMLMFSAVASAAQSIVRESPSFTITQPSGKETQLSHFKGKVVVIEFLFVRSPHCLHVVEMLNKLNQELGSSGFQPIAVAFGPYAYPSVLSNLVDYFKLTYPVGYATANEVDIYLGRKGNEILKIPQLVIIDRKGVIRATSGTKGDPTLENESSLRILLNSLLKENIPAHRVVPSNATAATSGRPGSRQYEPNLTSKMNIAMLSIF